MPIKNISYKKNQRLIKGREEWMLENHKKSKTTRGHSHDLMDPGLRPQSEQGCSLAEIGHTSNTRLHSHSLIGQFVSPDAAAAGLPLAERPASPAAATSTSDRPIRRLMWSQSIKDQSGIFILTSLRG